MQLGWADVAYGGGADRYTVLLLTNTYHIVLAERACLHNESSALP
jgi:hypothetical protein